MNEYRNFDANMCHQEVFNKLYKINTLINMVKIMCEEREYKGEYYNISRDKAIKLSAERNDYINALTIVLDAISETIKLSILMETKIN